MLSVWYLWRSILTVNGQPKDSTPKNTIQEFLLNKLQQSAYLLQVLNQLLLCSILNVEKRIERIVFDNLKELVNGIRCFINIWLVWSMRRRRI